jgi:hypothetical protein
MKQFRKNQEGRFVCEECGKTFKILSNLSAHLKIHNISRKEYYDKWIKEEKEGFCFNCGVESKYNDRWNRGCYNKFCSPKCKKEYGLEENTKEKIKKSLKTTCHKKYGVDSFVETSVFKEKARNTWLENYGVDNPMKCHSIQNKVKNTFLKKYGVDNPGKSEIIKEKIKNTNLERYGYAFHLKNINVKNKIRNTNLERYGVTSYLNSEEGIIRKTEKWLENYGVDNPLKSKEIRIKIKNTNLKKYGVENPAQNKEIYERSQKTRFLRKKFKDTDVFYQGSYELDFLEKFYDKIDIENGPSIPYLFEGKNKVYHSDFYIPSKNLIVEIKNGYLFNLDYERIIKKEKATINAGFNYFIIIDKNYEKFKLLV